MIARVNRNCNIENEKNNILSFVVLMDNVKSKLINIIYYRDQYQSYPPGNPTTQKYKN